MNLSKHAEERMQQRCIDPLIVEWALHYGAKVHDHRKGVKHYFDKQARRALERDMGKKVVELLSPLLNIYVVESVDDNKVITVAYRKKRGSSWIPDSWREQDAEQRFQQTDAA